MALMKRFTSEEFRQPGNCLKNVLHCLHAVPQHPRPTPNKVLSFSMSLITWLFLVT